MGHLAAVICIYEDSSDWTGTALIGPGRCCEDLMSADSRAGPENWMGGPV